MNKQETIQQNARITSGAEIVSLGGQIERIDDHAYHVKSQSNPDRHYEVITTEHGVLCSCPDNIYRGVCCKHVHAIEISRRMREAVQQEVPKTVIKAVDLTKCKFCDSANIIKKGIRHLKKGDMQQYGCLDCGKRFTHNLGFEGKRAMPEQITQAVELVFSGLSSRKAATFLGKVGVKVCHVTVFNWPRSTATSWKPTWTRYVPRSARLGGRTKYTPRYVATAGTSLPCWTRRRASG